MIERNENLARLSSGYLFPEINRRRKAVLAANPDARIISLGIGNTTEPLTPHVVQALEKAVAGMGTREGYSGYGDEQGMTSLREKVASVVYGSKIKPDEVFISDGAKCDIARLQVLFGAGVRVAVQDPSYPVYVDGSVIMGAAGDFDQAAGQYAGIVYMPCTPDNGFFPELNGLETDLIYFCSPNNPTGAVATREQLQKLVDHARRNRQIIIFDAAYSVFVSDPALPRSIFEIDGAREVAIEINSFSKSAGFTGLRLGWSVVPQELKYTDGTSVNRDWNRINTTLFNGASNIVQMGGAAVLDPEGQKEVRDLVGHYMGNARIIKATLENKGIASWGGVNSPYIWAVFPGRQSWDIFEEILNKAFVVTTPGVGFGPAGEGFLRFSAFGHRTDIEEACGRLEKIL
jgi:LL-diaminopimelate aminotransferase